MSQAPLHRPPAPTPSSLLRFLLREIRQDDGYLPSLMPEEAYRKTLTWFGYCRHSLLLINDAESCRQVRHDKQGARHFTR